MHSEITDSVPGNGLCNDLVDLLVGTCGMVAQNVRLVLQALFDGSKALAGCEVQASRLERRVCVATCAICGDLGLHGREEQHFLDVVVVGEVHRHAVDTKSPATSWRQAVVKCLGYVSDSSAKIRPALQNEQTKHQLGYRRDTYGAKVFVNIHGFYISTGLLCHLLAESGTLHTRVVQLCVSERGRKEKTIWHVEENCDNACTPRLVLDLTSAKPRTRCRARFRLQRAQIVP